MLEIQFHFLQSGHTVVSIGRVAHGGALRELHQVYRGSQLYQRILFMGKLIVCQKNFRQVSFQSLRHLSQ